MRIAIYHNLPSGGAKRTLYEAVKHLSARHTIDSYTLSCAHHAFADIRPFVNKQTVFDFSPPRLLDSPFGRLNQLLRAANLLQLRQVSKRVSAAIERGAYDIVYVQPCQFENSPSILHYLEGVPTVYYCQESLRRLYEKMPTRPYDERPTGLNSMLNRVDPMPALYHGLIKKVDRRNLWRATTTLVNSKFSRQQVIRNYNVEPKVSYHGVDVELFRPMVQGKQNMVLSVGSLTPLKGFDFLIRAMAQMPLQARVPLVIASNFQNSPERIYLEELATSLNVTLKLLHNIDDQKLVQLYNQALVTVYAPICEPFGLVALESMACGTPVVAVREGGLQETVIDGQTGLLVARDEKAFAMALQQLLTNPKVAREYGVNGRQHIVCHWTWGKAVRRLESHLTTC